MDWSADAAPGEPMRTAPLPMELDPQVVFERLFGSTGTPEMRAARLLRRRSHPLDSLARELARLKNDLGPADRRTINQYRGDPEIERRIELAAKASTEVPNVDLPPRHPRTVRRRTSSCTTTCSRALAFKADITRVATVLGARDLTSRVYLPQEPLFPEGGTSVSFHGGSHHQEDPAQIRRCA